MVCGRGGVSGPGRVHVHHYFEHTCRIDGPAPPPALKRHFEGQPPVRGARGQNWPRPLCLTPHGQLSCRYIH